MTGKKGIGSGGDGKTVRGTPRRLRGLQAFPPPGRPALPIPEAATVVARRRLPMGPLAAARHSALVQVECAG